MAKKIEITLFDNFHIDFEDYKESYQECKELTDEEMTEVSDNDIWDFIYDSLEMEWDDLSDNLSNSENANVPCVITGTLGLWHGRPTIAPVACDNIESAIRKCANKMDYIIVKQVNGHIEVTGIHNDGRNHFEIHILNDKGIHANDLIEEGWGSANLSNRCYHKTIKGYLF